MFIGLDANIAALKAAERAAARKAARGGAPNVAYVAASVEDVPGPLAGTADAISVFLPWGSLLQAVLSAEGRLRAIRETARAGATFQAVVSLDLERDAAEWRRLGLPPAALECRDIERKLAIGGWCHPRVREISRDDLAAVGTTWAKRIARSPGRRAWRVTAGG